MGKQAKMPLSAAVEELRVRLQEWRLVRTRLGPLPNEIWDSAVILAKEFGIGVISKAVGLDYTWLRKRAMEAGHSTSRGVRFIELPSQLMQVKAAVVEPDLAQVPSRSMAGGSVIDISTADGARMRMSLEPGKGVDVAGIIGAFLGSSR